MENVQVILTGLKRYSFQDRETGRQIEGTKAHFLQVVPAADENTAGYIPAVANLPYEYFERAKKLDLPHLCDAILSLQLTGNKPQVKVTDFIPKEPYPLTM